MSGEQTTARYVTEPFVVVKYSEVCDQRVIDRAELCCCALKQDFGKYPDDQSERTAVLGIHYKCRFNSLVLFYSVCPVTLHLSVEEGDTED